MIDDSFSSYSQAAGAFNDSPNAAGGKKRVDRAPTLPLTPEIISKLLPGEEHITIGRQEFSDISVCGRITSFEEDSAKLRYTIADEGNHQAIVGQWVDRETKEKQSAFVVGDIVKVYGKLNTFDGQVTVTAFKIRPVESELEVEYHRLEVECARLFYEKDMISKIEAEMAGGSSMSTPFSETTKAPSTPVTPGFGVRTAARSMFSNGGDQVMKIGGLPVDPRVQNLGLNDIRAEVLEVFCRAKAGQRGSNVNTLKEHPILKNRNPTEIKNAVEWLATEGHVYSTFDEDYYRVDD